MYAFVILGLPEELYQNVTKKFLPHHWICSDGGNFSISLKTSVIYSKLEIFRDLPAARLTVEHGTGCQEAPELQSEVDWCDSWFNHLLAIGLLLLFYIIKANDFVFQSVSFNIVILVHEIVKN